MKNIFGIRAFITLLVSFYQFEFLLESKFSFFSLMASKNSQEASRVILHDTNTRESISNDPNPFNLNHLECLMRSVYARKVPI